MLAPVLAWLAWNRPSGAAMGACLIAAFLSDIFDGVIARRLGIATPGLRRLDSVADSIFYVAALLAVWHLQPQAITARVPWLAVLGTLELLRYALDLARFRREASYHMWSSKLWGIALFAGFLALLGFGADNALADGAVLLGIVADLEGLAISLVLPAWQPDVPSLVHALRIRRASRPRGA